MSALLTPEEVAGLRALDLSFWWCPTCNDFIPLQSVSSAGRAGPPRHCGGSLPCNEHVSLDPEVAKCVAAVFPSLLKAAEILPLLAEALGFYAKGDNWLTDPGCDDENCREGALIARESQDYDPILGAGGRIARAVLEAYRQALGEAAK